MPKVLHTAKYVGMPLDILQSVVPEGFTVETLEEPTYESLLRQCVNADYLLVSGRLPIDQGVLSNAKQLKMIQRTGVGTEMLDLEAIKQHSIPVYVNKGVNARSVAEHTLTLILCCLKNMPWIDKQVKSGVWKKQQTGVSCHELYGKVVGLVGMGAIGKQVASYLKAFGAKVLYTDLYRLPSEQEQNLSLSFIGTFKELLPLVDILSFHCPLTTENLYMLNAETLAMIKKGAIVINTARGKLIKETDLYKYLVSNHLKAVALDVHEEEPIKYPSVFTNLDNVIMTPHIAGLSYESFLSMMKEAMNNIAIYHQHEFKLIEEKLLKL